LRDNLPEKKKHMLRLIFKEVAYRRFLSEQEEENIEHTYNTEEE